MTARLYLDEAQMARLAEGEPVDVPMGQVEHYTVEPKHFEALERGDIVPVMWSRPSGAHQFLDLSGP